MKLELASGSEPVNPSELDYTISLPEKSVVIDGDADQTSGLRFRWVEDSDESPVLSDSADLVVINFDLSEIDQIEPIKSGVSFTISVDVPDGSLFKAAFLTPKQEKLEQSEEYIFDK